MCWPSGNIGNYKLSAYAGNLSKAINFMLCPINVNSNITIELTMHTSCYWFLDLLCVIIPIGLPNTKRKNYKHQLDKAQLLKPCFFYTCDKM